MRWLRDAMGFPRDERYQVSVRARRNTLRIAGVREIDAPGGREVVGPGEDGGSSKGVRGPTVRGERRGIRVRASGIHQRHDVAAPHVNLGEDGVILAVSRRDDEAVAVWEPDRNA